VARRDVAAIERVGVRQQIAELGERVAADARDRRPAAAVLADEVPDDVQVEPVLQIESSEQQGRSGTSSP
jgi:hypothetical protein